MSDRLVDETLWNTLIKTDLTVEQVYTIYIKDKPTPQEKELLNRIKTLTGTKNPWIFRFPERIKEFQHKQKN